MPPDELRQLDPLDEELVAYLDGELETPNRARVEQRLADDEPYRDRLRSLQQAWDMLDLLPKARTDHSFTSTTMSLIAAQEEVAATQAVQRVKRRRSMTWVGIGLIALSSVALGYALTHRRLTREDRELVQDLSTIEQVDQLHNTPSLEFLEKLREEGIFEEETP